MPFDVKSVIQQRYPEYGTLKCPLIILMPQLQTYWCCCLSLSRSSVCSARHRRVSASDSSLSVFACLSSSLKDTNTTEHTTQEHCGFINSTYRLVCSASGFYALLSCLVKVEDTAEDFIDRKKHLTLLLTHSLLNSFSWSSTPSFSNWPRRSLRPESSSPSSVFVPTETAASVAMVNPRISVGVVWTSRSNRPLSFADWAGPLPSSSLW